jgi:two-component system cell cycle sensor histidine kinase/response regulator CckA
VLVVDDEAGVRELSRRILTQGGYRVLEAANGQQALELIESGEHIDFLMVDLDMPVMRGETLAEKLRVLRPELRVLFVTAHSDALFTTRPELRDGQAFLDKPYSVTGLLEAVSLLKNGYIHPPTADHSVIDRMWRAVVGTEPKR